MTQHSSAKCLNVVQDNMMAIQIQMNNGVFSSETTNNCDDLEESCDKLGNKKHTSEGQSPNNSHRQGLLALAMPGDGASIAELRKIDVIFKICGEASKIFGLPQQYFEVQLDRTSVPELELLQVAKQVGEQIKYDMFPPVLFPDGVMDTKSVFKSTTIAKILEVAFHGPKSLEGGRAGSKSNAKTWDVTMNTPGFLAWGAVVAVFLVFPDKEFPHDGKGAKSGLKCSDLFCNYKKILIMKANKKQVKEIYKIFNQYIFSSHKTIQAVIAGQGDCYNEEVEQAMAKMDISSDKDDTEVVVAAAALSAVQINVLSTDDIFSRKLIGTGGVDIEEEEAGDNITKALVMNTKKSQSGKGKSAEVATLFGGVVIFKKRPGCNSSCKWGGPSTRKAEMWLHIDGSITKPNITIDPSSAANWEVNNKAIIGFLQNRSADNKKDLEKCVTAKDAWAILVQHHKQTGPVLQILLIQQFLDIKYNHVKTYSDTSRCLSDFARWIFAIGIPDKETFLTIGMLNALSDTSNSTAFYLSAPKVKTTTLPVDPAESSAFITLAHDNTLYPSASIANHEEYHGFLVSVDPTVSINWDDNIKSDILYAPMSALQTNTSTLIDPNVSSMYLDTGTSIHISNVASNFFLLQPTSPHSVNGVGGSSVAALGIGSIKLHLGQGAHFTLHNVLYIPSAMISHKKEIVCCERPQHHSLLITPFLPLWTPGIDDLDTPTSTQ
ncbi:hypothetical protein SERLA73DRAFT_157062 [Serpula lacrymans var. lacrymans S7.3]|uniref:Retrovirus-related Pol polyprotein from transposon TNT 1-94-like beta-barrel domain-containing protein n=1 Tax=Serpula lacrymans var. lacrymans (strain S7.3) TaxID=936435 RepID=F8QH77_SERL3|nr:hypothetical protein SERLA73DRAFT_157062 [Serpula lacrymans var. lacrymans S7.3]